MFLYNMKKYLTLWMVAFSLVFVSCTEAPEVSINKVSEEMNYKGGVLEFDVTANCDWEIICDSDDPDILTVSQWTGGAGTQTVTVVVDRNRTNSILKHYFTAVAHGKKRDALQSMLLTQGAPAYVQFSKSTLKTDYIGGVYKFTVSANFPWEITVEGDGITVEPTSGVPVVEEEEEEEETTASEAAETESEGEGQVEEETEPGNVITVTIDEYEGDTPRSFLLHVSAQGEDAVVEDNLVITQEAPSLTIGNREYRIKKMDDGRWWMVENVCFSNKGITIGDNKCGVWYPCSDAAKAPDETTDGIVSKGLIYSDAVAFNMNITQTKIKMMESTSQGICPAGWHIPTLAEYMALVGYCEDERVENVDTAPYFDAATGHGSFAKLQEAGFIGKQAGYYEKSDGENNYELLGFSTIRRRVVTTKFYSSTYVPLDENNSQGKIIESWYALVLSDGTSKTADVGTIDNGMSSLPQAGSVRCIKDKKVEDSGKDKDTDKE